MGDFKIANEKSVSVILEYQQDSGAYPASPYFPVYNYSWIRDGSFTADAMSRAGEIESAEKFFEWCSKIILDRREAIVNGHTLNARYTYDGEDPSGEWASTQLDGYGTLIWAIKQHGTRHNRDIERYKEVTDLLQLYLVKQWREPCYDWWEERLGQHAASLACVYAGLRAYDNPEAHDVKQAIQIDCERTDASMLVCFLFDAIDEDQFAPLLEDIESTLVSEDGGVYRYKDDSYFGGGEWPVLTALLGWCYVKLGRIDDARQKLEWCESHMQNNGWLPEQKSEHMLHPEQYRFWVEKWGEPANPLLWSQAMFISLARNLL